MKFSNVVNHFKTITTHKYWVMVYCFKFGLYWQGITHDLSKYSFTEFFDNIKYYEPGVSPIIVSKRIRGYSNAWMHHKGINKHHYEYWQDNFDEGGETLIMPYKYSLEMLCDFLAAGKTYMGKDFSYSAEYKWWLNRLKRPIAMHPVNKEFITEALFYINTKDGKINRTHVKNIYFNALRKFKSENKDKK